MVLIADTWNELLKSAEFFHLDMEKFCELEPFFKSLDKEFFRDAASRVGDGFPEEKVKSAFNEDDQYRFLFLAVTANAGKLQEYYRKNNFPGQMLEWLSYDLKVWTKAMVADLGFYGLTWVIFGWQTACLTGQVKQFGRLQCNDVHYFNVKRCFYRDENGVLQQVESLNQLPAGTVQFVNHLDPCINLHIPASGPLDRKECIAAIKRMIEFYREFYPDYHYKAVVCYSWLLDRQLRQLLPEKSNILQFQYLGHNFDIPEIGQDMSMRWRLWDESAKNKDVDELVCQTSLQKKVVEFWRAGGHFIEGGLIIFPDELPALFNELK
ncbi:MAG: hypothetical protein E7057_03075 [Lentisphaerae bacterium]|nr:hypothetical protein [Lentisphaerota bacterium]